MNNNQFHIDFKLNGNSFSSVDQLLDHSKEFSETTHQFLVDWFAYTDFIKVKTSGSTGKPKTIQLKKEFMINSANATGEFFNLPEKTTVLLCISTNYIAGKMMLVRAFVLGWHLDVVEPVSNPLKGIEKNYDFSAMVPMQLQNSLLEIEKVKKLIVGGGIVSQELEKQIQGISTEIFATFGMTETITHIAVRKLNNFMSLRGEMTKQSYNKEIPLQIEFARNDEFYQVLPNVSISKDHRNCLLIDAPKVAENRIVTNDIIDVISKTEFYWLGRYDNVINSGGIKLHPEEIEKELSQIITQRFFVAGIPDMLLGEKLILIIERNVISSTVEKSLATQLVNDFKKLKNLTKFETPKAIYFVDEFIETDTQKIQRNKTVNLLLDCY